VNYNTTLDYNLRAHAASKYLMRWFLDSIRVGEIQTRACGRVGIVSCASHNEGEAPPQADRVEPRRDGWPSAIPSTIFGAKKATCSNLLT